MIGAFGSKVRPDKFYVIKGNESEGGKKGGDSDDFVITDSMGNRARALYPALPPGDRHMCFLWFAPIAALIVHSGTESVFVKEAVFFSKAAVVTFGGAYSVLAYIAQEAVSTYGWLSPEDMLNGLGMAETTPGPLIQVVQFVGFMGAYRNPGTLDPLLAGVLGSILTTWVTFVPCFFWIFLGAPYIEYLRGNKSLSSALSAITATIVGVILNLAVWFSLHTLFGTVDEITKLG